MADGLSLSIGAGWNTNFTGDSIAWEDGGGVGAYLQVEYVVALSPTFSLTSHWIHLSQWDVGAPFNNQAESSVDHIGVAFKWNISK